MYRIVDEPFATADDRRIVSDGLRAHNQTLAGEYDRHAVTLLARDQTDAVIGGLIGQRIWGWLHVEMLWVAERWRGQGVGGDLLAAAEAQALEAECVGVYLETFDFQAPDFYRRRGYTVTGVHDEFPPGHTHYYMQKRLAASVSPGD